MSSVHFKLSISNGPTRRISFPTRPSWNELAGRIQALYNIRLGQFGVSYEDSDGDEVTLSSEEELRDFYDTLDVGQRGQLIKFRVVELSSGRIAELMAEATTPPPRSSVRNTFGGPNPLVFDMDQDWERLPLGGLYIPSPSLDSPHAFVEVVDDETEKENGSRVGVESPLIEEVNTDKTRDLRTFVEDGVSSSASVIADETPTKPPIHVQVHGLRPMDSTTFGLPPAASTPAHEPVTSIPTPLPTTFGGDSKVHPRPPDSFPDPPTPELDNPIDPNISLSNDLASLLNTLNSMFVEHPEVGQHLRTLLGNVSNGTYWNAQRDTVARVAEDIQRVARDARTAVAMGAQEVHRRTVLEARQVHLQAQQEAARRVTEAVGNILRVFGAGGAGPTSGPSASPGANVPRSPGITPSSPTETAAYPTASPSGPSGGLPLHHASPSVANTPNPPSQPSLPTGSITSTTFPPPLQLRVPPPPRVIPPLPLVDDSGARAWNQFKPFSGPSPDTPSVSPSFGVASPEVSYYTASANKRARPNASELRASLEAAKANYKVKKEEYRQEQEARRRERRLAKEGIKDSPISPGAKPVEVQISDSMGPSNAGTSRPVVPATMTPPIRQIISNARGGFPQLEMVNLPRSPTKQRGDRTYHEGDKAHHVDTVVERLLGMGFQENAYPTLRTIVESHLPSDGTRITKEVEDDAMSEILERLLEGSASAVHSTT